MSIHRHAPPHPHERSALIAAIAAFATWGLIPAYWKFFPAVPAQEILAHRFVWTSVFLVALLTWQGRWGEVQANARSVRAVLYCLAAGSAIAINWFVFIWAVNAGRVVETSLGYFMTPLVNILFGAVFLRERLTRRQLISVFLVTLGVVNLTLGYGRFPWVALALCLSFGAYGLLRKRSGTAAIPGLFFETALLLPLALAYLIFLHAHGTLIFEKGDWSRVVLFMSTGLVTAVPLVWFGHAARYLRLTTVGFLQYLSPSESFCLGIFVYHETFTRSHLITFGLIWAALGLFTFDALSRWRTIRADAAAAQLERPT